MGGNGSYTIIQTDARKMLSSNELCLHLLHTICRHYHDFVVSSSSFNASNRALFLFFNNANVVSFS